MKGLADPKTCHHDTPVLVGEYVRTETVADYVYDEDSADVRDVQKTFRYGVLCCPDCGAYIQTDSVGFWLDVPHTLDSDFIRFRPNPGTESEKQA